jgi:tetratricopeptide (TPR) repeat protein
MSENIEKNWNPWIQVCILTVAIACVYAGSVHGDFIWDDNTYIMKSSIIHSPDGLRHIWTSQKITDFWPLSYTLYWVMWKAFGTNPVGYHVVGVMLHLGTVVLLWRTLIALGLRYAFWAAMFFAVHPVCVESVAWIIEVKTTLAAISVMGATFLYVHTQSFRDWRFPASLACFTAAMLAKAAVAPWPCVLLLIQVWKRKPKPVKRTDIIAVIPFFAIALALTTVNLVWYANQSHFEVASEAIRDDSWASRLVIGGKAFWFYFSKAMFPINLSFIYPRWTVYDPPPLEAWLPLGTLVLLVGASLLTAWKNPRWLGWSLILLYILLMLAPVLGVFDIYQMRYTFVTDHWQYFALIGFMVLTTQVGGVIFRKHRIQGAVLATMISASFGWLAYEHAKEFGDEETIWRATLTRNPDSWMVHKTLGLVLKLKGRLDEAEVSYRESIKRNPQAETLYNLAIIVEARGDYKEALGLYLEALRLNPYHWAIFNNLGSIQARLGYIDDAIVSFRKGLEYGAGAITHFNLGLLLEEKGKTVEARQHYTKAALDASDPKERAKIEEKLHR